MSKKPNVAFWVLAATILGSSMSFIDSTVVYVVLPTLQRELNASVTQAQWIVEAYVLLQAALILVGGSLGDRFGRRRIFAIGTAMFALASALCGLALNANQLIAARLLQALGGALLAPSSLAVITAYFDEKHRGKAIGAWSGASAIMAAAGPVLGGVISTFFSWRWVFFINVPLAALTLFILYWRVPESRDTQIKGTVDWLGAALAAAGLGGVTYGLIESSNFGWGDWRVQASIAGGLLSLAAFVYSQHRSKYPMVPLTLFRSRSFSAANLLTLLLFGGLSAMIFFLPFNLIQVQGYTPLQAGAMILPLSLVIAAGSGWAGGLWYRYGPRRPLTIGPLIVGAAFLLFARIGIGEPYVFSFLPAVVVLGVGMTVITAPLTTTVMSSAPARLSGTASGINNTLLSTANVLAVALLGVVALHSFSAALNSKLAPLQLPAAARQELAANQSRMADLEPPAGLDAGSRAAVENAVDESFIAAFRNVMVLCAGLAAVSAAVAWFLINDSVRRR
jgi:EmrB/QacA subfamily drug resistance transporter